MSRSPARGPRAVLYLAGAAAVAAGVLTDTLDLPRTALAVAAVLVLVGLAGGAEDGPWGAALVVAGAGAGALLAPQAGDLVGSDVARETSAGVGAGVGLACVVLLELAGRPWGVAATLLAVAATVATLLDDLDVPALQRPITWAALLFLLGAVNLLLWARDRELGAAGPRP
ncbi:hypothetical protein [Patulibacter sp.]|uniref:hypothetical protein n=1 Tax=Patulibacter sp. TaxID=1912859 RepID=UPI00271D98A1|nr:hypothetical protein [Patulibacter sp.]MDO9409129.1 hypothetical protein [Patulibacter sp.]